MKTHSKRKAVHNSPLENNSSGDKEMRYMEFAKRLEGAIKDAGLWGSQREMAEKLGASASTINNLLTGEKLPSHARAVDLAVKLNVDVDWLMTGRLTFNQRVKRLPPEAQSELATIVLSSCISVQYF